MAVASAPSRCIDACMGWLYYLRIVLQLVWLRANRALWQTRVVRPGKMWTRHKIVVLGDGFAEGFADNLGRFVAETPLKFELDFDAGY